MTKTIDAIRSAIDADVTRIVDVPVPSDARKEGARRGAKAAGIRPIPAGSPLGPDDDLPADAYMPAQARYM